VTDVVVQLDLFPTNALLPEKNGGCTCGAMLGTAELFPGLRRINTSL
jgi:hypothetical protein